MCDSDVFTADPDGTGVVQLNDPKTVADQPAWSPDGDWIAFRQADSAASQDDSTVDPDADVGLVVISPDLTATRTLDAKGVKAFAWSPEGDRLRYVRSEGQGRPATLWEVPFTDDAWADGKAPKARALGLSIDAAIPSYYTRRGAGIAWQSLARAADMPSVPSAKPATPAPAVAIATPRAGAARRSERVVADARDRHGRWLCAADARRDRQRHHDAGREAVLRVRQHAIRLVADGHPVRAAQRQRRAVDHGSRRDGAPEGRRPDRSGRVLLVARRVLAELSAAGRSDHAPGRIRPPRPPRLAELVA